MAITPTRLAWGSLLTTTTARATIASGGTILRSILLLNPTSGPIVVTATITPTSGTAIPIVPVMSVPATSAQDIDITGGLALLSGDALSDSASATGATIVYNTVVVS